MKICGCDCSIIDIANDFSETYARCTELKNVRSEGNITKGAVVNIPAIVNGAFAIELYLKSMIDQEKLKKRKIHEINTLFYLLDNETKTKLETKIKGELPKLLKLTDSNTQNQDESERNEYYSFEECLEEISEAFVFWRYIHEKEDLGFGFQNTIIILPIFLKNIREVALDEQKVLKNQKS